MDKTIPYNFVKNSLTLYLIMAYHNLLILLLGKKIFWIFLLQTDRPSLVSKCMTYLVSKCMTISDISDHEAVLIMSDVSAKVQPPGVRKNFQWWKANFDNIE